MGAGGEGFVDARPRPDPAAVAKFDLGGDVGINPDEAVAPDGDGGLEQGEPRVGHVVGARAEVGAVVDTGVVPNGDEAEAIEDDPLPDADIVATADMPGDGDFDRGGKRAVFADPAPEEPKEAGALAGESDPDWLSKEGPGEADEFFAASPD